MRGKQGRKSVSTLIFTFPNLGFVMDEYNKCRTYGEGRMEMDVNERRDPPPPVSGFHRYMESYSSTSCPSSIHFQHTHQPTSTNKDGKHKKGKGSHGSSSSKGGWSLSDPEMQRKKRVASYKVYAVEGKMKGSIRKSFRWIKERCNQVVHGWW